VASEDLGSMKNKGPDVLSVVKALVVDLRDSDGRHTVSLLLSDSEKSREKEKDVDTGMMERFRSRVAQKARK
jgi:hypothetical protein